MVRASFYRKNGLYCGFIVSGHAGGRYGTDIVCAGVSSAVMLTVNTVTDFLVADASVKIKENAVGLRLNKPEADETARAVVYSLKEHLQMLARENGGINVVIKEI